MERRQFLQAVGAGAVVGLAGCDGQGADTITPDVGGDDVGVGDTQTPASTSTETAGDGTGSTPSQGSSDSTRLGDVSLQSAGNFRFRVDAGSQGGQEVTVEGRASGNDFVSMMSTQSGTVETYFVDGSYYSVANGECFQADIPETQSTVDTEEWTETDDTMSNLEQWPDVTATGTEVVDGEEMYVFEVSAEDRAIEDDVTYYISTQSGFLRRIEVRDLVIEYWDWGNVGPIEAPC